MERKIYFLSRKKREEVCKFINKKLRKKYIRLLKSPQIALVFFVRKKKNKKCIVQDYRYLNKQTIKNNYPLPLISYIVENIGMKKVFTKLELWWDYNNIQQKIAFTTLEGLFEPIIMFFGLTNLYTTFQMIINEILWMTSFINNVIVEIKKEKGYNKVIEGVVKRL